MNYSIIIIISELLLMTVVGIVAEYNPLHSGHLHHLKSAREATGADSCVCVLSSNFVQRGEPALFSKWARAKMALSSGADLVLELPCAFSCASAEYFASCAVRILDSLNTVDYLCFGSEEGNIEPLETAAELLAFESHCFKDALRKGLDEGLSFAASRERALKHPCNDPAAARGIEAAETSKMSAYISKPNNILGIEYIKAIKRMGSSIKPITIPRAGQGYHSLEKASSFSSATAIRKHLFEMGNTISAYDDPFLRSNVPDSCLKIMTEETAEGRGPVFGISFESILLHLARTNPEYELSRLPYMGEGLENRLKRAAIKSRNLEELISSVATKRYPATRVKRVLISLLTGMTGEFLDELKKNGYAQYIRVLGFNDNGRRILSNIRKKAGLPVITKPASLNKLENSLAKKLFEHEIRAANTYVLGYPGTHQRAGGIELVNSPIYIKD